MPPHQHLLITNQKADGKGMLGKGREGLAYFKSSTCGVAVQKFVVYTF